MCQDISAVEANALGVAALCAAGVAYDLASRVVDDLIVNDIDGYGSHGLQRIPQYVGDIISGTLDPRAMPRTEPLSPSLVRIEGRRAFGLIVREIIAEQLVSAVTMTGIAAACLNDAHHLGRLAGLGRHLASPPHNITVIGFCNYMGAGARLAPPGGSRATLCTNPILIAVPIAGASPFNLDMSTTVVAEGRVNVALGANGIVPSGWLIDADSKAVTDAAALYATPPSATIAPLGYPISPHKGFGLALAVELLVGAIAGASNVATPGLAGNAGLFIAFKNSFFPKGDEIPNIARAIVEKAVPEGGRWPGKAHTALVRTNLTFPKSFLDTLNTLSNAAEAKHDS